MVVALTATGMGCNFAVHCTVQTQNRVSVSENTLCKYKIRNNT